MAELSPEEYRARKRFRKKIIFWSLGLFLLFAILLVIASYYFTSGGTQIESTNPDFNEADVYTFKPLSIPENPAPDYEAFIAEKNRYKECEKGKVIKNPGNYNLDFQGVGVYVKDSSIVRIGNLRLTYATLAAITEKFAIVDDILYQTCIDLGREYDRNPRDKDVIIFLLNRKYDMTNKLIDLLFDLKAAEQQDADDNEVRNIIDTFKISTAIPLDSTLINHSPTKK